MRVSLLFALLLPAMAMAMASEPALNDDILGLIVFKAGLHDPEARLASWNEDADSPCYWVGVKCDLQTKRVVELALDGFSLSGKIGRGLLQLQSLQSLSLSKNNFSGGFTLDLSHLGSLQSLDLSENDLSGEIPDTFSAQCASLKSVSFARNRFSGAIPAGFSACSSLISLNLSSNQLTGGLNPSLWSLSSLRSLDLSCNGLSGEIPLGIEKMVSLRSISLRENQLTGSVPEGFGGLSLLKSLDLRGNLLSGELPAAIQRLSACDSLLLGRNAFSGEFPAWVSEMAALETLDLSFNRFTGEVPYSLGDLQRLKLLDLSGNGFGGSLPKVLGLSDLDLSRNAFSGELPLWIFEQGLQRVSISDNKLSGAIKFPNSSTHSIVVLDLSGNSFSGVVPAEIGSFRSLQSLNLSQNKLSGGIPAAIGSCSALEFLVLSENNLTGELPLSLASLGNLQSVDLSQNRLSGGLPRQLGELPRLRVFNISHNLFSGDLPSGNFFNTISPSSVAGNPSLCGGAVNRSCPGVLPKPIVLNPNSSSDTSSLDPSAPSRHKKILLSISAVVAIAAAALIAAGVVTVTVLNHRVRRRHADPPRLEPAFSASDGYRSGSPENNSGKLVMFSGGESGFSAGARAVLSKDSELGRGGFGCVYKTRLADGRPVAIKKLAVSGLVKSREEFEAEVKKLGKLRHPNLVALEGFYWTPSLQLLIYEFIGGGSLHRCLHEAAEALMWRQRFHIILGVARSLAELHRRGVIHYNIKSSNVLLDSDGEAKVVDYGLAKLLPALDRYVLSAKVQSALGYMAPEFACRTVKVTEKCDVYGFGVLVLEVVTGRRPVEYTEDDVAVLCDAVRGALEEGAVVGCVDRRLAGGFEPEEAVPVIKLGLICTSQVPSARPDMAEVVSILEMIGSPRQSSAGEDLG